VPRFEKPSREAKERLRNLGGRQRAGYAERRGVGTEIEASGRFPYNTPSARISASVGAAKTRQGAWKAQVRDSGEWENMECARRGQHEKEEKETGREFQR